MTGKVPKDDMSQEVTTLKLLLRLHFSASTLLPWCPASRRDDLQAVHARAGSPISRIEMQSVAFVRTYTEDKHN